MLQTLLAGLLALFVGSLFLLYGYRLFMVLLPVWGFFAGLWLGAYGVTWLFGDGFFSTVTGWAFGFGLGLLLALVSWFVVDWGIALVAAAASASVVAGAVGSVSTSAGGWWVTLLAVAVAITVAYMVERFALQRIVVVVLTVIGGANAIVVGILLLVGQLQISEFTSAGNTVGPLLSSAPLWAIVWLALAIGGFYAQMRLNRAYSFTSDRYLEGWG